MIRFILLFALLSPLTAARMERYALVLEDPPVAEVGALRTPAARDHRARLEASHLKLRAQLASRGVTVTGAVQTLVNAIFVQAGEAQAHELRRLPGVKYVQRMRPLKLNLNKAVELVNAPGAWNALGGAQNAGAGVKIGILDTGIDPEHPAFQDSALRPPDGFPKVDKPEFLPFTNGKIIVARSYVDMLVLGDQPEFSRPDDLTPRDRVGHGTAAASVVAGARVQGPAATIQGVAPKAYLGNYKIFGSPGVNDVTFDDVVIEALNDAFQDGMDIVSLSIGAPALWAPGDTGTICGKASGQACDIRADAVNNAVRRGMTVVISAGNDGDSGLEIPALNSVHAPGTAAGAITVAATTNAHRFFSSVRVLPGGGVPGPLQRIDALFGNGPKPQSALTAPLKDVSTLQDDGKACSPLTNDSLAGAIALILRGDCAIEIKVNNAQRAGAAGVIVYQPQGNEFVYSPQTLQETGIPAVVVGYTAGQALKSFLVSNPGREVSLDPALVETTAAADEVAWFSSQGPSIDMDLKPEIAAVGTDMYVATQNYDPNGLLYDPSRFTNVAGTSFSAPMVAGAAALVKQRNPRFTPAQIKSALVNTASLRNLVDYDNDGQQTPARVTAVGAGKLNAEEALKATVTADPAALSFGIAGRLPVSRTLRLTNGGTSQTNLSLRVNQRDQDNNARVVLGQSTVTLAAGASASITVQLQGTLPRPGDYEGDIVVTGGGTEIRIPYVYFATANIAFNAFPLNGQNFTGVAGQTLEPRLVVKFVDSSGVPVANLPVRFRSILGGGSIDEATRETDELGIAESRVILGPQIGEQGFSVEGGGLTLELYGQAMVQPAIRTDGVGNAASGRMGEGLAPGSYISIFGSALSETLREKTTSYLPLSLSNVSVSFDVPSRRLSLPGRLHFVSEKQVNVQVPWELQGLTSAQVKVSIGDISSALYNVTLKDYSPELFQYTEAESGRRLIAARDEKSAVIGTVNPVRRGSVAQLYANGVSPLDGKVESGEPATAEPLLRCRVTPSVTIGGQPAQVSFCGLAPFIVGLYQINATVPQDAPVGIQPVVVSAGGVSSQPASLPIQ